MDPARYIHGTDEAEQARLLRLNALNNEAFLKVLPLSPTDHVLEVGSGLGVLARLVSERVPQGRVVGVEYSADQLARGASAPRLTLLRGDGNHLPFPEATFDVAYCRWLLEHVRDPLGVLREMFRVMKPGGHVLVEENDNSLQRYDPPCPQFEHLWRQFSILQGKLGGDGSIGSKLFRLMRRAGFTDVRLMANPHFYAAGTEEFACWVENESAILRGAAEEMIRHDLARVEEVEGAVAELLALLQNSEASSWFYFSQALARRPVLKRVLFVCVENSNRSQMAEAFARMFGGDWVEAYSSGSRPSGRVNPNAVEAMRELGYDLSRHRSKSLEEIPPGPYDAAVTMGCGDACPIVAAKLREDWQIPDPRVMSPTEFRGVRDLIGTCVKALLARLK
jgi:arsenate reductase